MTNEELYKEINNITDGNWWRSSTYDIFVETANVLIKEGVGNEIILGVLQDLYYAVSSEYGN